MVSVTAFGSGAFELLAVVELARLNHDVHDPGVLCTLLVFAGAGAFDFATFGAFLAHTTVPSPFTMGHAAESSSMFTRQ